MKGEAMAAAGDDLELAAEVLRVRFGQLIVNERLKARSYRIPIHLALGHEGIAVAVSAAMTGDDALCLTHRNIHYNMARARSLRPELAELRLAGDGVAGGWLGSMNMANPPCGVIYTSSILGNDLCVAAGVALGGQVAGLDAVTFVVTGDGAMEEGAFYESLLFLKGANLPAIMVVENNDWSMATRIEERRCPIAVDRLAAAFDAPYERLDGGDVIDSAGRLRRLRALAAERRTPVVVEVMLSTLGDWRQPTPEWPEGKFINYHHGAAPTVALSDWPVIRADETDPLHVLARRLGEEPMRTLARRVRAAVEEDVREDVGEGRQ